MSEKVEEAGAVPRADEATVVDHDHDPAVDKAHKSVVEHARAAQAKEQQMTLLQGIKLYPKAIMFSVIISTCIVMEGYDISLINNFYAFSQFNRKYGIQLDDGTWEIPAAWQAGLSNVSVSNLALDPE
jgi:SP family general alpha glucoside:H+ symporter-like MFS transporter